VDISRALEARREFVPAMRAVAGWPGSLMVRCMKTALVCERRAVRCSAGSGRAGSRKRQADRLREARPPFLPQRRLLRVLSARATTVGSRLRGLSRPSQRCARAWAGAAAGSRSRREPSGPCCSMVILRSFTALSESEPSRLAVNRPHLAAGFELQSAVPSMPLAARC